MFRKRQFHLNNLTLADFRAEAVQGGQQLHEDLDLAVKELPENNLRTKVSQGQIVYKYDLHIKTFLISK
jgi:hypothetical protein